MYIYHLFKIKYTRKIVLILRLRGRITYAEVNWNYADINEDRNRIMVLKHFYGVFIFICSHLIQ